MTVYKVPPSLLLFNIGSSSPRRGKDLILSYYTELYYTAAVTIANGRFETGSDYAAVQMIAEVKSG